MKESPNPLVAKCKELMELRDEVRREQLAKEEAQKTINDTIEDEGMKREEKEQRIQLARTRIGLIDASESSWKKRIAKLEAELSTEHCRQCASVYGRLSQMASELETKFFAAIAPFYNNDEKAARRAHRNIFLPTAYELERDCRRFHVANGMQEKPVEDQVAAFLSNLVSMEKKYGWTE